MKLLFLLCLLNGLLVKNSMAFKTVSRRQALLHKRRTKAKMMRKSNLLSSVSSSTGKTSSNMMMMIAAGRGLSPPRRKLQQSWTQLGSDIEGEVASDYFGSAVAINDDGSRIAAGAFYGCDDVTGHVRVFDWTGSSWTMTGSNIAGEAADDFFGETIDMNSDGSRIVVGGTGNDGNGLDKGHVRVYELIGGTWTQLGPDIDGQSNDDEFGVSVAMNGDGSRIAVGATQSATILATGPGYVRVYDWTGSAWVLVGSEISGELSGDWSGYAVDMNGSGSRIVVSSPESDGGGVERGHVRVFELTGSQWVKLGSNIEGELECDLSGDSVAMNSDGSRVAIGTIFNDGVAGEDSGHVRVYEWNGSQWTQLGADIDGEGVCDEFGFSVSMNNDGSRIAVGATGNDDNGPEAGHVRVFQWTGSTWMQIGSDIDGAATTDLFGSALAMSGSGSRITVGAPENDGSGFDAGHVRVFEFSSPASTTTTTARATTRTVDPATTSTTTTARATTAVVDPATTTTTARATTRTVDPASTTTTTARATTRTVDPATTSTTTTARATTRTVDPATTTTTTTARATTAVVDPATTTTTARATTTVDPASTTTTTARATTRTVDPATTSTTTTARATTRTVDPATTTTTARATTRTVDPATTSTTTTARATTAVVDPATTTTTTARATTAVVDPATTTTTARATTTVDPASTTTTTATMAPAAAPVVATMAPPVPDPTAPAILSAPPTSRPSVAPQSSGPAATMDPASSLPTGSSSSSSGFFMNLLPPLIASCVVLVLGV